MISGVLNSIDRRAKSEYSFGKLLNSARVFSVKRFGMEVEMKLAVMGDIHSNHIALETCIEHALARNVDEFLFLGDYVSDCPYPQKTMKMIYEMKEKYRCTFIRGNREDYMLDHRKNPQQRWTYSSASGNLLYTYENLTKRDLDFYEEMDIQGIYVREGYPVFRYCHGSPARSNELLTFENDALKKIIEALDVDLIISGHTHVQESVMFGSIKLIHPGSVGLPWYYEGKTQYMILHGTDHGWEEEFFQLNYDVDAMKEEFLTSGIMEKALHWPKLILHCLYTGNDYTSLCLPQAMKLCREAEGEANWPDIPEKYWEMAFAQLVAPYTPDRGDTGAFVPANL